MIKIRWKDPGVQNLQVRECGGVTYLSYPALERTGVVRHGFSTRLGGVSQGCLSSMNLGFGRGDERANVEENFRRIAAAIGFSVEDIVTSDQTHTTNVRKVTAQNKGSGIIRARDFQDVDGMITDVPGVVLATFYADCVPLYFVDPVNRAIGLSHSGWRGTVGKIGRETVEAMGREYGTRAQDLTVAIGPSICRQCYEVSEDVIRQFQRNFPREQWPALYDSKENGKYQLDLWKANQCILEEAGVLPDHIVQPNLCTCCNSDFLFSHRASRGKRGNLAAFLELTEEPC